MNRTQALAVLADVQARVSTFADVKLIGSSLIVNRLPAAFINASDAIVVHQSGGERALSFPKPGAEGEIASLILARFVARRAA